MMWDKNGMLSKGRHMTLIIAMVFVLSMVCPLMPGDRYVSAESQTVSFKDVSVNDYHACIVDSSGDLYTFGKNAYGMLGHGDSEEHSTAKKVLENVRSVKASYYNTAAITEDDSLWVWGFNYLWPDSEVDQHLQSDEYEIADNSGTVIIVKPVKVMTGVKSVAAATMFMAYIDQDDSLWLWGSDSSSLFHAEKPVKVMDDVKEVSLGGWGGSSACIGAVKKDGTLWTWGVNRHGNLGISSDADQSEPVKIMDDVVSVSMGDGLCGAVKEDGSLWTWGESDPSGEMPTKFMDGVKSVSINRGTAGAVQSDGSLWTWGDNTYGGLGDGTMEDRTDPVKILDNVETVSMGLASAAIDSENTFWFWGNVYFQQYWGNGEEDRILAPERFSIVDEDEEEEEEDFTHGDITFNYEKSYDKTEDGETTVFYDNDFFDSDNTKYNHKLATASLGLAMAGMHKEHVKGFLKNSGFSHNMEFSDRFDLPRTDDQDKVAYTFATKEINGTTVIAVVLRGGDYGNEWGSNGRVGHLSKTYGYHYGFSKAAEDVILNLLSYCNQNGINLNSSKIWLTGYSRSAAVSNCVGMMLERDGLIKKENLYCYTFATPRTVTEEKTYNSAQGIYNIVNPLDVVPCVPLNSSTLVGATTSFTSLGFVKPWNYTRHGNTLELPSALGTWKYRSKLESMKERFAVLTRGERDYSRLVGNLNGVILQELLDILASSTRSESNYVRNLQDQYIVPALEAAVGKGITGDAALMAVISQIPGAREMLVVKGFLEKKASSNKKAGIADTKFFMQHWPETYLAWMRTGIEPKKACAVKSILVQCPVDVEVYDSDDELVARIINDKVDESIEGHLESFVDEAGAKTITMPAKGNYRVVLTAAENGSMTYSVKETDENRQLQRKVTFEDINISDDQVFTGEVNDEINTNAENYNLTTGGDEIEADHDYTDEEIGNIDISVDVSGEGTIIGDGSYTAGDSVVLEAFPYENYSFTGWYSEDGQLISQEPVLTEVAEHSINYGAVFTKQKDDPGQKIASVYAEESFFSYDGEAKDPGITAYDRNTFEDLTLGKDYTVTFLTDRTGIGEHRFIVRFTGDYANNDDIEDYFIIYPAKAGIKSVKPGKKKLTVKIKSQQGDVTYQTAVKIKGTKKWKKSTTATLSKTIRKLKSGKRYQVKVRAFKYVDGHTWYGKWSKTKTVKVR